MVVAVTVAAAVEWVKRNLMRLLPGVRNAPKSSLQFLSVASIGGCTIFPVPIDWLQILHRKIIGTVTYYVRTTCIPHLSISLDINEKSTCPFSELSAIISSNWHDEKLAANFKRHFLSNKLSAFITIMIKRKAIPASYTSLSSHIVVHWQWFGKACLITFKYNRWRKNISILDS